MRKKVKKVKEVEEVKGEFKEKQDLKEEKK